MAGTETMKEIVDGLYVGTVGYIPFAVGNYMSILGACKDPLHKRYARLMGSYVDGYISKSMPADEPEYLYAERRNALYCNLIDAPDEKYISPKIIDRALKFIDDEREIGRNVLIVCNHAKSRSPSIALMWMIHAGYNFPIRKGHESIISCFKRVYYPLYEPGDGFRTYVKKFWKEAHSKNNYKEK